jgi:hypothetical protein
MKKLHIIVFIIMVTACSVKNDSGYRQKRPANIPENSFWAGGVDGGNWYFVHSIHDHRNNAIISVYDEEGKIIVKKRFAVICRLDKPVIWIKDLEQQINGFDGQKILLKSTTGNEICWMQ